MDGIQIVHLNASAALPVLILSDHSPGSAPNSYGSPQSPVATVQTVMNPFTGSPTTLDQALPTVGLPPAAEAAPDSYAVGQQPSPVIVNRQPSQVTGNAPVAPAAPPTQPQPVQDVYGSPVAPVGTSAPVPDEYSRGAQVQVALIGTQTGKLSSVE